MAKMITRFISWLCGCLLLTHVTWACPIASPDGCYCREVHRPQMTCFGLTSFPEFGSDSYNIHTLDLTGNSFTEPVTFPPFTNLRRLILKDNSLTNLDGWNFESVLSSLEYLHLEENQLEEIPEVVFLMQNINTLNLSHNNIHSINWNKFERNTNLRKLHIDQNPVSTTIEALEPVLPNLSVLYITLPQNSHISTLPSFPALKTLAVTNCDISLRNSEDWFEPLTELSHLAIESHGDGRVMVDTLPWRPLAPRITHLSLAHNALTNTRNFRRLLQRFIYLEYLDLSWNQLESYSQNLFESMEELNYLSLAGNQLVIRKDLLIHVPNLQLLDIRSTGQQNIQGMNGNIGQLNSHLLLLLDDNPWRCDCGLQWLWELIHRQEAGLMWHLEPHEIMDGIRCEEPGRVMGYLVRDLEEHELNC